MVIEVEVSEALAIVVADYERRMFLRYARASRSGDDRADEQANFHLLCPCHPAEEKQVCVNLDKRLRVGKSCILGHTGSNRFLSALASISL